MRKTIARALIVVFALTGFAFVASAPPASAHHRGGHHCRWNAHRHDKEFYQEKKKPKRARQKHSHHNHACNPRPYPLGAPTSFYTAR